ncbi:tetratricopeptide repeat protein [Xanthomarina sp. F2636L]|uniref:tetratricopeptide repeat protein n=1 Tax=Xanthomarina sp. F2636L TaxID=2996018 RepID=UPI00225E332C|nr:hypothetical protein [Xanthomarina sp. F2636L]MCX7551263.1 hypothetical protein [Xanthomarina sp. F2636L]
MTKLPDNSAKLEFSKKEILQELDTILSSDLFSRSSVLSSFLKFIVEETLKGNTEGLKEYTIAVNALGKSVDFNPQIDAIVRIHAGRLRRLLNEYYTTSGVADVIKIEVVKGTYVPVFRTHLIKKPKIETKSVKTPTVFSRSKLTLAVLPFRNLCPDNDYKFFVDGFGEELTRLFSRFEDIAVIAHHSTRKYATNPEDIRIIGSDLGVHYIISGSVKRSSDKIWVNVELLKTMNGMQVWSKTYNYPLNIDNLINIQDQIVENVCSVLGGYYGFIIHENSRFIEPLASNLNSFDAAFWNYYFHMNYSEETYLKTRKALENAISHDPNYATGLAMLAELYVLAHSLGYPTVKDPVQAAFKLTKKALKIDPRCQHANHEYGWLQVYLQNKEEAVKALEYTLTLNPYSVSLMGGVGFNLACAGEYGRAEVLLTQSLSLNPHCPWWFYFGFFLVYYQKGNYQKALEYANKIETVDVFVASLTKASAKAQLGLLKEAQEDVKILNKEFSEIMKNLYPTLEAFLLDKSLVNNIIQGAKKAGVNLD